MATSWSKSRRDMSSKLILLVFVVLLIGTVSALEFSNPSYPKLVRPTSSTSSSSSGGNSTFNQTLGDLLYWRLDASNDPPSANWDMGGKSFFNIGASNYTGNQNFTGNNLTDVGSIAMKDNSTFTAGTFVATKSLISSLVSPSFRGFSIGSNTTRAHMAFIQGGTTILKRYVWLPLDVRVYLADSISQDVTSDGIYYEYNGTDFVLDVINATSGFGRFYGNYHVIGNFNTTGNLTGSQVCIGSDCRSSWPTPNWLNVAFLNNTQTWTANQTLTNVFASNVSADCMNVWQWNDFSQDSAAPPNGYYPLGSVATTSASRGYYIVDNIEIGSYKVDNGNIVQCVGSDASTNTSCKVTFRTNISGALADQMNITLFGEKTKIVPTSLNMTTGDMIMGFGYGNVVSNASSQGLTSVTLAYKWRYRC